MSLAQVGLMSPEYVRRYGKVQKDDGLTARLYLDQIATDFARITVTFRRGVISQRVVVQCQGSISRLNIEDWRNETPMQVSRLVRTNEVFGFSPMDSIVAVAD